jgi:hypothetical protein
MIVLLCSIILGFYFSPLNDDTPFDGSHILHVAHGHLSNLRVMILYHESNVLHLNLKDVLLSVQDSISLAERRSDPDPIDIVAQLTCGDLELMVSRETAPSLLRIAHRIKSMLSEQRRKLKSRLVALRPQESAKIRSPRFAADLVGEKRRGLLRSGKINIGGKALLLAFFQNSFNDVDWLQASSEAFDLSFETDGPLVSPREVSQVSLIGF